MDFKIYERHFKKSNLSSKIVLMLPLEVFCNRAAVRIIPRFVPGQHKRKQPQKSDFESHVVRHSCDFTMFYVKKSCRVNQNTLELSDCIIENISFCILTCARIVKRCNAVQTRLTWSKKIFNKFKK